MTTRNAAYKKNQIGFIAAVDKKTPGSADRTDEIVKRQLFRNKQDIKKWRSATTSAESVLRPDRVELYRIYKDVVLDAHLSSLMRTIRLKLMSGNFMVMDSSGDLDEETTAKLKAGWFRKYLEAFADTQFYGHSLLQLSDIVDDQFESVTLYPRENVIPEEHMLKQEINIRESGWDYTEEPQVNWVIEIGDRKDLGLLHKVTPHTLWKKNVISAWSEFAEVFGQPTRIGKTEINDPVKRKNMETMLGNVGSLAYGVFDTQDTLEFIASSKSDAFKVYKELIELNNAEMSKLILGQTGTTDEKAFAGSADVHKTILESYIWALKEDNEIHVNDFVLPIMVFHGMIPDGSVFRWDKTEHLDLGQKFDIVDKLSDRFNIPNEWISKEFGVPIEEDETPPAPALTGGQVTSIQGITDSVASGSLPKDSAKAILMSAFKLTEEVANSIVDPIEEKEPEPPPPIDPPDPNEPPVPPLIPPAIEAKSTYLSKVWDHWLGKDKN